MTESRSSTDLLNELAHEFAERYRCGERPTPADYARQYPLLAERILDLFPALQVMEEFGSVGNTSIGQGPVAVVAPLLPTRLGEYRLLREVARGGMGIVYEAVQESLGRHVALKVLPRRGPAGGASLERFRREARAAANLHHTNIVPVFGVGEEEGVHFYAMQLIHGQSLDRVLEELRQLRTDTSAEHSAPAGLPRQHPADEPLTDLVHKRLGPAIPNDDPGRATVNDLAGSTAGMLSGGGSSGRSAYFRRTARIAVQAAEALAYAHQQGVLHRDVKPSNLLLDTQGALWVTDFGLAKVEGGPELTSTGDLVGTLAYMAPERFRGQADGRSDVYSLGLTLYELLTLQPAFTAPERAQLIDRLLSSDPPRPRLVDPSIPRNLETIVLKATAKEPAARYPTAAALAEDLHRFLADQPILARRLTWYKHVGRWCRRNPLAASLLVLLAVVVLAGISAVTGLWLSEAKARQAANQAADQLRDDLESLQKSNALLQSARYLVSAYKYRAAHDELSKALTLRPDNGAARSERAELYLRMQLFDLAAADFAEVYRHDEPATPRQWYWHALLRAYVGDTDGYRRLAARTRERFPPQPDAPVDLAEGDAALTCTVAPAPGVELGWALESAEKNARRNPIAADKQRVVGLVRYRQGDWTGAVRGLRRELAGPGNNGAATCAALAMALHQLGQAAEARSTLAQAATELLDQSRPDYPTFRGLNNGRGQPWFASIEGVVLYREATRLITGRDPPEDPMEELTRGYSFHALGDVTRAAAACDGAAKLGRDDRVIQRHVARLRFRMNQLDAARAALAEMARLKAPPVTMLVLFADLVKERRWADADAEADRLIEAYPQDSPLLKQVAAEASRLRHWNRVIHLYALGMARFPADPSHRLGLANAQAELGQFRAAEPALKAAVARPASWTQDILRHVVVELRCGAEAEADDAIRKLYERSGVAVSYANFLDTFQSCTLRPAAAADWSRLLAIYRKTKWTSTGSTAALHTGLLYRAGLDREATKVKQSPATGAGGEMEATGFLYAAMAHERLGEKEQAREMLEFADELFTLHTTPGPTFPLGPVQWPWWEREHYRWLRAEAATLFAGG